MRYRADIRWFLRSRRGVGVVAFLGVGAALTILYHRVHVAGDNLVLGGLLLACILMHLFMHGGHENHGGPGPGSR